MKNRLVMYMFNNAVTISKIRDVLFMTRSGRTENVHVFHNVKDMMCNMSLKRNKHAEK